MVGTSYATRQSKITFDDDDDDDDDYYYYCKKKASKTTAKTVNDQCSSKLDQTRL